MQILVKSGFGGNVRLEFALFSYIDRSQGNPMASHLNRNPAPAAARCQKGVSVHPSAVETLGSRVSLLGTSGPTDMTISIEPGAFEAAVGRRSG